jgi:electron transfer flavoprotein beta subunit
MNILVILKHVPDLVEELEINPDGTDLDRSWMRYIPSEYDEHALEQAILLKEEHGGTVTALTLQIGEVEDTLFTASAKGADHLIRIEGAFEGISSRNAAAVYADHVRRNSYDLILTGVQAYDDLEGPVGARLAAMLALPYVGVVSGMHIDPSAGVAHLHKEYPGGMLTVIRTELPAVVGIQSAMKPPRYVPIAKIRQASKSAAIDSADAPADALHPAAHSVRRVAKPETGGRAEMIEGGTDDIAARLLEILSEHGLVR